MTHVLLTRSPLSPEPKPWFSLDLHVLGAPPAFVLSQDQTLREDLSHRPEGRLLTVSRELEAQSLLSEGEEDGCSLSLTRRSA
jgi:hypothetical protein